MNLQLRKFKPETISDDRVCVFIGKRNTGKSTLVKDIMFHKRHLPAGIVLSGTEEGNHFYSDFIPDLFHLRRLRSRCHRASHGETSVSWWVMENKLWSFYAFR
jgi:ABC-type polar amino acid transport system ATPase subunit